MTWLVVLAVIWGIALVGWLVARTQRAASATPMKMSTPSTPPSPTVVVRHYGKPVEN